MLKFQYVLKTVKKHVENFRIQVLKWSVPDAHPDSRALSILKFSGIFENCMRGIFYSLKDTLLFKCSEFCEVSEEVYTRCTSRWLSLEYSGIEIRQFTQSAEIKREIPFCTRKWILEYSGIEIRQFTHSAEIKREIPFCTRKRSETYS